MSKWLRMPATVAAAILIAATLTIAFGYIAVMSLLGVFYSDRIDPSFARGVLFGSDGGFDDVSSAAQNASGLVGLLFGGVVILSTVIVIGLILKQSWARESAMVIYGFLGLLSFATSINGVMADPPASAAWLGVLTGVANLSVVVLLLMPVSAREFLSLIHI